MTVDEYKAEFARCQHLMIWRMVYSVAVIFGALGLAGCVRYYDSDLADIIAPAIIFAVGFPLMLFGFHRVDRTYQKFPGLICPHCGGSLSRAKSIIIATGNCPSCGRRILKDDSIGG